MSNVTGTVFDSQPSTSTIIWIVCDSFLKPKKRQSVTLKALDIQVNISEIQGKHRVAEGWQGLICPCFRPVFRLMWLQYGNQPGCGFIADDY